MNERLDVVVQVSHFPGRGQTEFQHLSPGCALGQRLKINGGCCSQSYCFTMKPLLSLSLLLPPNWLQDLLTFFIRCFDRSTVQISPADFHHPSEYFRSHFLQRENNLEQADECNRAVRSICLFIILYLLICGSGGGGRGGGKIFGWRSYRFCSCNNGIISVERTMGLVWDNKNRAF